MPNLSKIADIMTTHAGRWPTGGGVLSGFAAGQLQAQRNQQMKMQQQQMEMQNAQQQQQAIRESKTMEALRPLMAKAFNVNESILPEMDLEEFKDIYSVYAIADDRQRKHVSEKMASLAAQLEGFDRSVPQEQKAQIWPTARREIMQTFPEIGEKLNQEYNPRAIAMLKAQSTWGRDLLKAKSRDAMVSIDLGSTEQDAYEKKWGAAQAASDVAFEENLYESVQSGNQIKHELARMEALLNKGTQTGIGQPAMLIMKEWLSELGVNVDPTDQEEIRRLGNNLAFEKLAQFKGATSEKELDFAMKLVGNLANKPESIRRYIIVTNQLIKRNNQVAELYNKEVAQSGGNARGIRRKIMQWLIDNPLINTPKTQADFDKMQSGMLFVDPEDGKFYLRQ